MTRQIDVVLFDLDDTLHDDTTAYRSATQEVAREVAAEHGIDAMALTAAYIAEAEGFWHRLDAQQLRKKLAPVREALWGAALRRVGLDDEELAGRTAHSYNSYRKTHFKLFPGALDVLRSLRRDGKRLGLLTNGFSETHREKISLLQLGDAFDAIFIADEVGMLKPDPLLFAHACTSMGVAPMFGAMIGDRYDRDIYGALTAGLFTIWLNVRGESLPEDMPAPHAVATSIVEVTGILEQA